MEVDRNKTGAVPYGMFTNFNNMYLTYFNTPAVTTTLTGISEWFNPLFSDFWNWGLIAIGVSLVFAIIGWLISHFHGGLKQ